MKRNALLLNVMNYKKIIFFLIIFCCSGYFPDAQAQELNIIGDTILVKTTAGTQIQFPGVPQSYSTVPENAPYIIDDTAYFLKIRAGFGNSYPAILLVSEGGRNHRFIVLFKKDINLNPGTEIIYDFSTTDKIKQYISHNGFGPQEEPDQTSLNQTANATTQPAGNSSLYYTYLEIGDKNLNQQDYQQAMVNFNKAHALRPQDLIPISKIEEIKSLLAGNEKPNLAVQLTKEPLEKQREAIDSNYNAAITSGDTYFYAGDYESAKKSYTSALSFIVKDWPKNQISIINKMIAVKQEKRAVDETELKYTALVREAEKEYGKGNYTKAKEFYTNASKLKPAEEGPIQQLLAIQSVNKSGLALKVKKDNTPGTKGINIKYNTALSNARSRYDENDLLKAKSFYEEASDLKPGEAEPKNQLKTIAAKLEEIEKQKETDRNYEYKIALADSWVNAKAYNSALSTYNKALLIKPNESYPKEQIKLIQAGLAEIARKKEMIKREEDERRYGNALTLANQATANKKYDEARSAYHEALSIHPEDTTAKKKLELISSQIEKENALKLNPATIVKEMPVKKSNSNK